MNESTEKVKRNFLTLSPDKKAEALALLLRLADDEPEKREHLLAVHDTLKNLADEQGELFSAVHDALENPDVKQIGGGK